MLELRRASPEAVQRGGCGWHSLCTGGAGSSGKPGFSSEGQLHQLQKRWSRGENQTPCPHRPPAFQTPRGGMAQPCVSVIHRPSRTTGPVPSCSCAQSLPLRGSPTRYGWPCPAGQGLLVFGGWCSVQSQQMCWETPAEVALLLTSEAGRARGDHHQKAQSKLFCCEDSHTLWWPASSPCSSSAEHTDSAHTRKHGNKRKKKNPLS